MMESSSVAGTGLDLCLESMDGSEVQAETSEVAKVCPISPFN